MKLEAIRKIGEGVSRPEDVVVSRDGTVWASDNKSACAAIGIDGTFRRVGNAGGDPNGVKIDPRDGAIIIANIGNGAIQRLDPHTGVVTSLYSEAAGERLITPNYVLFDKKGNLWCTVSTRRGRTPEWLNGTPDGFIVRIDPSGRAAIVADKLQFPNGLAFDDNESALFVAQTSGHNVLRFPVRGSGLGAGEVYGPASLGDSALPDGIAMDQDGGLWVTLVFSNRVERIARDGTVSTVIEDPTGTLLNKPTNIAFGGKDLRDVYIGSIAADYVVHARSPLPGLPLVHQ